MPLPCIPNPAVLRTKDRVGIRATQASWVPQPTFPVTPLRGPFNAPETLPRSSLKVLNFDKGDLMDYSWIDKIVIGLIILGAVVFTILRAGAGIAAVVGLGHFPMSMIPSRLRRFLFGEQSAVRKPNS